MTRSIKVQTTSYIIETQHVDNLQENADLSGGDQCNAN